MNTPGCPCRLLCLSLQLNWGPQHCPHQAGHKASGGHVPTYMMVPRRGGCPGTRTSQRLPTGMALACSCSSLRRWVVSASRCACCACSSSLYRPSLLRFRKERTESVGGVEERGLMWPHGWGLWPNEMITSHSHRANFLRENLLF